METTHVDDSHAGEGARSTVILVDTQEHPTTREQTLQNADHALTSFSPLTSSMRPFGLYFTRKHSVSPSLMTNTEDGWRWLQGQNFVSKDKDKDRRF